MMCGEATFSLAEARPGVLVGFFVIVAGRGFREPSRKLSAGVMIRVCVATRKREVSSEG